MESWQNFIRKYQQTTYWSVPEMQDLIERLQESEDKTRHLMVRL
jgi:hypothetical protein